MVFENNMGYLEPLADMLNSKIGANFIPYLQSLVSSNEEIANKDWNIGDREIQKAVLRANKAGGLNFIG